MEVPRDARELEKAVKRGSLQERATLEFKREVSASAAAAVAAMTVNGGTVVVGVDEDGRKRPAQLAPLADPHEAKDDLSRTITGRVMPPPSVHVNVVERDDEAGYLVVEVPPSPQAPHMVFKHDGGAKPGVFYTRDDSGNQPMDERTVEQLYLRRHRLLGRPDARADEQLPAAPDGADGPVLRLAVTPTVPLDGALDRAAGAAGATRAEYLNEVVERCARERAFPTGETIRLTDFKGKWKECFTGAHRQPSRTERMEVGDDGAVRYAEDMPTPYGDIDPVFFADAVSRVVAVAAEIVHDARNLAPLDVTVRIDGLAGKRFYVRPLIGTVIRGEPRTLDEDHYAAAHRCAARMVYEDPAACAREVLGRFVRAGAADGAEDPFDRIGRADDGTYVALEPSED